MNNQELYIKVEEFISKFEDGKTMYRTSPLFNVIVTMLAGGSDVYSLILHLIKMNEHNAKAFEQYMLRDTRPLKLREDE